MIVQLFFLVRSILLLLLTTPTIHAHAGCLTQSRPLDELTKVQARIEATKRQQGNKSISNLNTCRQCITIVTHITVYNCRGDGLNNNNISRETVNEQFAVLVQGYSQTPFTFRLASVEFIVNDDLCSNFETTFALTARNRKGGYDALNIFLGGAGNGSFGTYPIDGGLEQVPFDGAFVDIETVPGGNSNCCNQGKTLIHEVGHWLGLEHTFGSSDNPCNPSDRNDFVDDTPAGQATAFNCPVNKDTCPLLEGLDPIHNYMDYSSDDCYESFTRGQMDRMYYVWSLYRRKSETCSPGSVLFQLDVVLTDGGGGVDNAFELASTDETVYWAGGSPALNLIQVTFQDDILNRLDLCIDSSKTYEFVLYDIPADGLGPGGYYELRLGGVVIRPQGPLPSGRQSEKTTFRGDGLSEDPFVQFLAVLREIIELLLVIFGSQR